ncbi:hypothetical protein HAZT_HAZT002277 [Hyalella azteca]|uniref:Uncharacterized protein n=1 Tax=Hyalella azteca TaxID=294128 RepID=A0A6A0HAU7_HYAAZ|nr:hypothetical protein HAZT_HAZT002277 [Hyalella azteca]
MGPLEPAGYTMGPLELADYTMGPQELADYTLGPLEPADYTMGPLELLAEMLDTPAAEDFLSFVVPSPHTQFVIRSTITAYAVVGKFVRGCPGRKLQQLSSVGTGEWNRASESEKQVRQMGGESFTQIPHFAC